MIVVLCQGACPRGPDGPRFERVIAANRRWQAPSESTRARRRALAAHRARTSLERKRPRADSNRRIEVLQFSPFELPTARNRYKSLQDRGLAIRCREGETLEFSRPLQLELGKIWES